MNKYEITFIVKPDLEEAQITKTAADLKKMLKSAKAKLVSEKADGQKELAYEIKKYSTGYYFLLVVEADKETIAEFDRIARINENLLRHLVVKVED